MYTETKQSHHLGMLTRPGPSVDAENDMFPVPLTSSSQPRKVQGVDRLFFAIWYLQSARVRELLFEMRDMTPLDSDDARVEREAPMRLFARDFYGHNIVEMVCSPNHCSNLMYTDNRDL